MEKISDYGTYTDGMRKSMTDKTWFLSMIDGTTGIVDYGCADGALLEYIRDAMPGVFNLTGIDIDRKMLSMANDRLNVSREGLVDLVTPDTYKRGSSFISDPDESCLNCGSVIHEVYSYGTPESIEKFWDFAFGTGFEYIAIRDMAMSKIELMQDWRVVNDSYQKDP